MIYKYRTLRTLEVLVADEIQIEANTKEEAKKLALESAENDMLCPELLTTTDNSYIVDSCITDSSIEESDIEFG